MPVNLKKRRAAKAVTTTVDVDGDTLTLSFVPKSFTVGVLQSLRDAEAQNTPDTVLVPILLQTVTAWDLEGDDGETVPLTAEALSDVPLDILNLVLEAVLGETTPPPPGLSDSANFA